MKKVSFLRVLNFPPSLIGGLLGLVLLSSGGVTLPPAKALRDLLLIIFFVSVGLGLQPQQWHGMKRDVLKLSAFSVLLIILQNFIGVALSSLMKLPILFGLIAGSVTFVGGLGSALAWGGVFETLGVVGATEAGILIATIGLVVGALVAGPVTLYIIKRHSLKSSHSEGLIEQSCEPTLERSRKSALIQWVIAIALSMVCIIGGEVVQAALPAVITLPAFLTAMIVAVVLVVLLHSRSYVLPHLQITIVGTVSLSCFIALTLSTLELAVFMKMAGPLLIIAAAQVIITCLYAYQVVFKQMGKDYDAAVIAGSVIGFGLSSFSIAMATMRQVNHNKGPSPRAHGVISFVGSSIVDLSNAVIIGGLVALLST